MSGGCCGRAGIPARSQESPQRRVRPSIGTLFFGTVLGAQLRDAPPKNSGSWVAGLLSVTPPHDVARGIPARPGAPALPWLAGRSSGPSRPAGTLEVSLKLENVMTPRAALMAARGVPRSRTLASTRHAESFPDWVERKFQECVLEAVRRLELFPDLRMRYVVSGT